MKNDLLVVKITRVGLYFKKDTIQEVSCVLGILVVYWRKHYLEV